VDSLRPDFSKIHKVIKHKCAGISAFLIVLARRRVVVAVIALRESCRKFSKEREIDSRGPFTLSIDKTHAEMRYTNADESFIRKTH